MLLNNEAWMQPFQLNVEEFLSFGIACRLVDFFLDIGIRFGIGSFGIGLAMAGPVIANGFRLRREAGLRRGSIVLSSDRQDIGNRL